MAKYSRAPWTNDGTEVGTGMLHDVKVAKCYGMDYEEARANAKLIAAAPELLEAVLDLKYKLYGSGAANPKLEVLLKRLESIL